MPSSLLSAASALRFPGAAITVVTSLAVLVYHSYYLATSDLDSATRLRESILGGPQTAYSCAIALVFFSALSIIIICAIGANSFFGDRFPPRTRSILWISFDLASFSIFVVTAVAVSTFSDVGDQFDLWDSANFNKSKRVMNYVYDYQYYDKHHRKETRVGRSLGASQSSGDDIWDQCGWTDDMFDDPEIREPGAGDNLDQLEFFAYGYAKLPTLPATYVYNYNFSADDFFTQGPEIPGCFNATIDAHSLVDARIGKDLCSIKLESVTKCAPGWSVRRAQDSMACGLFSDCTKAFRETRKGCLAMGAVPGRLPNGTITYGFEPGWDKVSAAASVLADWDRTVLFHRLRASGPAFRAANTVFVAASAIGFVVLTVGIALSARSETTDPPSLQTLGGAVLIIVSFGFLIYNAASLDGMSRVPFDALSVLEEVNTVIRRCSRALAAQSGLSVGVLLVLAGLSLLEVASPLAKNILWFASAALFVGELIAAAVGIDVASSPLNEVVKSRNYNMSTTIQSYVDGAKNFLNVSRPRAATGARRAGPTEWDACGRSDAWFDRVINGPAGSVDDIAGEFLYAYSAPGVNPPWDHWTNITWLRRPQWEDIYSFDYVNVCYGSVVDGVSAVQAQTQQDMCLITIKEVSECAPGWSLDRLQTMLCNEFKKCREDFAKDVSRWTTFGGVNVTPLNSSQEFQLPEGWNRVDEIESYLKSDAAGLLATVLLVTTDSWFVFNTTLLAMGLVGWVGIVLGLVSGVITACRGGKAEPGSAAQSGTEPAVSTAPLVDAGAYE
jgi:hypothetical protein